MILSPDQVKRFWREWPKACSAQNWTRAAGMTTAEIDRKRKEFLARCGFASLTEVDRTDGFTKVLNELLVLQGTSINAGIEAEDPSLNRARVLRHQILTELIPCLEVYVEDVRGYMTAIMEDKNRWWKIDRPARDITINDLSAEPTRRWSVREKKMKEFPSQLEQLQYTLSSCLNGSGKMHGGKRSRLGFRVAAGDSLHDMKIKARVPCDCTICQPRRPAPLVVADFVSAPEEEEQPF